jgi:hypothetical protein
LNDHERLRALLDLGKDAVKGTCQVLYDFYSEPGMYHVFGRGFVLVDRFRDHAGAQSGDRLLLLRSGALAVQIRVGNRNEWRAGYTRNGPSLNLWHDGSSYTADPLEKWAKDILSIYPLDSIARGVMRLLEERERSLGRETESVRARRNRAAAFLRPAA